MIVLTATKRTDERLLERMENHYSKPKGFVGRNICYAVSVGDDYFGHIVAGSATRFLPGRHDYLGTTPEQLNSIVNNIFFNVAPVSEKYPLRNFTAKVVKAFVSQVTRDWMTKYGDPVVGFETLVELPRQGVLYKRAGWVEVGHTKGYTCKRVGGKGTDSWTGKRVWDTENLKPKKVLCLKSTGYFG
jgi:hypothetical protein